MKDLERLKFTILNQNKPNEKDFHALNGIIKYVSEEKERTLNNYHLFAKVYISVFTSGIEKTNGNYQKIADELRMVLKTPIESIYDSFHQQMNMTEFENITNLLGMSNKHPALRTKEENENDKRIVNENAKAITKAMLHYNKDDVYKRLNSVITNLIEDYGLGK